MKNKYKKYLSKLHHGVVGFEYVIILTVMSTSLYGVFGTLQNSLNHKGNQVSDFIKDNGQNPLGTGSNSPNNSQDNKDNQSNNSQKDDNSPRKWTLVDPEFHTTYCYSWGQHIFDQGITDGDIYDEQLRQYMKDKNIKTVRVIKDVNDVNNNKQLEKGFMLFVSIKLQEPNVYGYAYIVDPAYTVDKDITIGEQMTIDQLIAYRKSI